MKGGPLKISGLVASGRITPRDADVADQRLTPKPNPHERENAQDCVEGLPLGAEASIPATQGAKVQGEVERMIPLGLIVDSPYQPRLSYDPEEIDHLAATMSTAKHADPIKVRLVNGKYELVSGHRRTRAARSLGWTDICAYVEIISDREAQTKTMLLAVGSVDLCDFELARMFDQAMQGGMCKTQREVANFFGMGTTKVNGCLDLLKLPRNIVRFLETNPNLFGYETGIVIKKLCRDYPDHLPHIERGVERLTEGATQNSLKAWVLQAIKGSSSNPSIEPNLITSGRRLIFTTRVHTDQRAVVINCKVSDIDIEEFEKALQAWLEEHAKKFSLQPR